MRYIVTTPVAIQTTFSRGAWRWRLEDAGGTHLSYSSASFATMNDALNHAEAVINALGSVRVK